MLWQLQADTDLKENINITFYIYGALCPFLSTNQGLPVHQNLKRLVGYLSWGTPYATRTSVMNTVNSLFTDTSIRRPPRNNGHLEIAPTFLYSFNVIDVYEINHIGTAGKKSNEEWNLQLWTQFTQLRKKAGNKFQDFNGVWTRAVAIPLRCSTKWATKPLMLGAGQLCVHMFP